MLYVLDYGSPTFPRILIYLYLYRFFIVILIYTEVPGSWWHACGLQLTALVRLPVFFSFQ